MLKTYLSVSLTKYEMTWKNFKTLLRHSEDIENYILFLVRKTKYHTTTHVLYIYKFNVITMKITFLRRTGQGDFKVHMEN